MEEIHIKLVIESELRNIRVADGIIRHLCLSAGIIEETVREIRICVSEALNNAVIHGYERRAGNEIEIIFDFVPGRLSLQICDNGKSLPLHFVNEDHQVSVDDPGEIDCMASKGRGLSVISEVMTDVIYKIHNKKNRLMMTKDLPSGGKG